MEGHSRKNAERALTGHQARPGWAPRRLAFLEPQVIHREKQQEAHLGNPVTLAELVSLSNYV